MTRARVATRLPTFTLTGKFVILPVPHRRPVRRARVPARGLAAVLLGLSLVACDGRDADTALTPEAFADVIVELREAEREALKTDSAVTVYARRKAEILERHGTTEEELRRFVEVSSRDLPLLDELWEDISLRLRRPVDTEVEEL